MRKIDTKLLAEGAHDVALVTQQDALKALQRSSVKELLLEEREADAFVGKHLAPLTHGHVLATSHLLGDKLKRAIEYLASQLDGAVLTEDIKAISDALNMTARTWCEAANVSMIAAEVVAHGKKIEKKAKSAPVINSEQTYVDNRTVVANGHEPNGNH